MSPRYFQPVFRCSSTSTVSTALDNAWLPVDGEDTCLRFSWWERLGTELRGSNTMNNYCLVGGWTNPIRKIYARQIGSSPQVGMKIRNIWNHHLVVVCKNVIIHRSYTLRHIAPWSIIIALLHTSTSSSTLSWNGGHGCSRCSWCSRRTQLLTTDTPVCFTTGLSMFFTVGVDSVLHKSSHKQGCCETLLWFIILLCLFFLAQL